MRAGPTRWGVSSGAPSSRVSSLFTKRGTVPRCPLAHPFGGERPQLVYDDFRPAVASQLAGQPHRQTLPEGAGLAVPDAEHVTEVPDGLLPRRDQNPVPIGKPVKYVGAVEPAQDLVLGLGVRAAVRQPLQHVQLHSQRSAARVEPGRQGQSNLRRSQGAISCHEDPADQPLKAVEVGPWRAAAFAGPPGHGHLRLVSGCPRERGRAGRARRGGGAAKVPPGWAGRTLLEEVAPVKDIADSPYKST